jgi:hypothetical protein
MGLGPLTERTEAGRREGGRGRGRERERERAEREGGGGRQTHMQASEQVREGARGRACGDGYPALPVMISTSPQRARLVALGTPPAVTADGLLTSSSCSACFQRHVRRAYPLEPMEQGSNRPLVTDAHWSSFRNNRLMFKTAGKILRIVLEELIEYV